MTVLFHELPKISFKCFSITSDKNLCPRTVTSKVLVPTSKSHCIFQREVIKLQRELQDAKAELSNNRSSPQKSEGRQIIVVSGIGVAGDAKRGF